MWGAAASRAVLASVYGTVDVPVFVSVSAIADVTDYVAADVPVFEIVLGAGAAFEIVLGAGVVFEIVFGAGAGAGAGAEAEMALCWWQVGYGYELKPVWQS